MSLFDERALREIVAEELRRVLREEFVAGNRPANDAEYLPVAGGGRACLRRARDHPGLDGSGPARALPRRPRAARPRFGAYRADAATGSGGRDRQPGAAHARKGS